MKNIISLRHFLLLFLSVTLISCRGDDESDANNPDNTNNEDTPIGLTIGNDFYPLQNGAIYDYGSIYDDADDCSLSLYNFEIDLYEQGITNDANGNWSGSGKIIWFEIYSDNNQLANGNYGDMVSYINSTFNRNASSFSDLFSTEYADVAEAFETDCLDLDGFVFYRAIPEIQNGEYISEDDGIIYSFIGGQLSFERNSSNGEITVSLTGATTDESRLPVSVYYKGVLTYFDETDKRPVNPTQRRKK